MPAPLHSTRIAVRWGDQDALGHVNNARYFTYIESARIEWMASLQEGSPWPGAPQTGPILASASMEFRRPVVYPATVVIDTFVARIGRSSFSLRSELRTEADGALVADATAVVVWIGADGDSTPLPTAVREALNA